MYITLFPYFKEICNSTNICSGEESNLVSLVGIDGLSHLTKHVVYLLHLMFITSFPLEGKRQGVASGAVKAALQLHDDSNSRIRAQCAAATMRFLKFLLVTFC